jgi:tRNA(Ile)-lysidine synthase
VNGLTRRFLEHCHHAQIFAPGKVIVAVSGGVDSLALLHLLYTRRERLQLALHVAHFDHGIRAESAEDAQFVAAFARTLDLPCTIGHEDVPALVSQTGLGIEAAARQARYDFLVKVAQAEGASQIVTAHHRDDQTETVLMHFLRGAGLAGLRGMLPRSELQPGVLLVRPLLPFARTEIEAYASEVGLTPRLDSTNADTVYLRNRLRLEIIPLLKTINPALASALTQLATIAQADFDALTALIPPYPLERAKFGQLPLSVQRLAIQQNPIKRENLSFHDVENALHFIAQGKTGDLMTLSNGLTITLDFEIIRFDEPLELHAPGLAPGCELELTPDSVTPLENGWQLRLSAESSGDPGEIRLEIESTARLQLRTRRNGDRMQPKGMTPHSQKLSDLFINLKVPAAWRDHVPLLTADEQIIYLAVPTPSGLKERTAEPSPGATTTLFIQLKFIGTD